MRCLKITLSDIVSAFINFHETIAAFVKYKNIAAALACILNCSFRASGQMDNVQMKQYAPRVHAANLVIYLLTDH